MRLRGRESLASLFDQSLIGRPIQHFACTVTTCLEYKPDSFMQMAGLVLYYDDKDYYYLRVTADELRGVALGVVMCQAGKYGEISSMQISVKDWERYYLKAEIHGRDIMFYASRDGEVWTAMCTPLDFGTLSDEHGGKLGFTGSYAGICAQDLDQQAKAAYFDYFEYTGLDVSAPHSV